LNAQSLAEQKQAIELRRQSESDLNGSVLLQAVAMQENAQKLKFKLHLDRLNKV
jgi:hypothetical protein